jgi:hypothetical protein
MRVTLPLLAVLLVIGIGCGNQTSPSKDIVREIGTVTYMPLEGGFWAIVADPPSPTLSHGATYDPLGGLPAQFQQQGLRIWFEGRIRDDMASIHMYGRIIEIINIRRL